VEAELKRAIPDIREVLLVDEIDPDMLNFARRILRQEKPDPGRLSAAGSLSSLRPGENPA
jgi:hypothetical protein